MAKHIPKNYTRDKKCFEYGTSQEDCPLLSARKETERLKLFELLLSYNQRYGVRRDRCPKTRRV